MKIIVLGCGSIGKRHIGNILSLKVGDVSACDVDSKKLDAVRREFPITTFDSLDKALNRKKYDAAFICTPPNLHLEQAKKLVKSGIHCFIEKPLSKDLEGIDVLIRTAEEKQRVVIIGYNMRFSPLFMKIKKIIDKGLIGKIHFLKASLGYSLPYWRPYEDYRHGYGAHKKMGGGIVLDASHEIDYSRNLLGEVEEVFAVCRKLSNLDIDTEDFAEIIMHHKSGAYSQIHLDYLQSNYRRNCEIIGDRGMLVWDVNENVLRHYGVKDKEYHVYHEGLSANSNEMYINEVRHFFRCMEGAEKPLVGLEEGKRIQEIIEKIKKSSEENRVLSV